MPDVATALPPFEPSALLGETLDGRYLLESHLATGGMGAVFRARHVHLRKEFAVKVLRPDLTASQDIVERFRREAEIASSLEHENIVRVTDFGRSPEGYLFLVAELLDGESLFDRLRRETFLSPEEAVPILWQICAALEAAHATGVVHRDLKPENVFLTHTASGRQVAKILDFGIAKIADPQSGNSTAAGMVVGTPEYLSPEQALGAAVDGRADLYAVGLIAWRTLVGRHPYKAQDARGLLMMQATQPVAPMSEPRPELAAYPGLVATVAKACDKEVERRHQTAAELRAELAASVPGFVPPAAATPAPGGSPGLPAGPPGRPREGGATPGGERTSTLTPSVRPGWSLARDLRRARIRLRLERAGNRIRSAVAGAAARARTNRPLAIGIAAVAIVGACVFWGSFWLVGKPAADARAHLAAGRVVEAREMLERAVARRPNDPELNLLLGRALHRTAGETAAGIDAYAAAQERAPLDSNALADLASDLGKERPLADRAARLLARSGPAAAGAVLAASKDGPGAKRLRALGIARDLGAEDRIDRVASYGALLADPECDVRRAAARRLGEIGDPRALPALRELAAARRESKGLFGLVQRTVWCGAADAADAIRRIEAAGTTLAPAAATPAQPVR